MLFISKQGHVDAERVKLAIHPAIERGPMHKVNGIVVHQTGAPTAKSTFNSYGNKSANGAHFLIDLDGTIYQTASLLRATAHVGLLRSRCLETRKCSPVEISAAAAKRGVRALHKHEGKKEWPRRFPSNDDAIGIELVGNHRGPVGREIYDDVTDSQRISLKWLVSELAETLDVSMHEVYLHPEVSYKNETEARTAKW
ncbi:peptidoglycan recognition family protein [Cupriavidus sp. WS]|uniref:peptidoglycan recognition protein family protein n=1 Tax=Cupriavidus sp. WS TaxID=1312922 RepID=UPI00036AE062|nr:peptidoglycan recognition family protein [Cupriavidus sp. WS]